MPHLVYYTKYFDRSPKSLSAQAPSAEEWENLLFFTNIFATYRKRYKKVVRTSHEIEGTVTLPVIWRGL